MKSDDYFIITFYAFTYEIWLIGVGAIECAAFMFLFAADPPGYFDAIMINIVLGLPLAICAVYFYTYRIIVSGSELYIRQRFGLVRYHAHVSDICRVKRKKGEHHGTRVETLFIYFQNGKKVAINPHFMISGKELYPYLNKYVSPDKFTTVNK